MTSNNHKQGVLFLAPQRKKKDIGGIEAKSSTQIQGKKD